MHGIRSQAAAFTLIALAAFPGVPVSAQSAKQLLETALERHEKRTKGIENYTIVQNSAGIETSVYFERQMVDGRSVFQAHSALAAGQSVSFDHDIANPYRHFTEFAERAKYAGTETVDGRRTHRIIIDDFTGLDINHVPAGQSGGFDAGEMTMYLDAEDYVIRRVEMEGDMDTGGRKVAVTTLMNFEDYRTTNGLLHPWRSTVIMDGMDEAMGMSPADRARMAQQLAELAKQMDTVPEAQQGMLERIIGGQMDRLREMLASGRLEIIMQVTEIRVNQGAP